MICDTGNRTITLVRATTGSGQIPMQILTETTRRTLNATVSGSGSPMLAVQLQARDPLLDAMALTKGRFAIETPGQPTLYLPSWAEVSRVIEDCR